MAEDIYFNTTKNKHNNKKYTERIEKEQLSSKPGKHSFDNIKTEDEYIKAPNHSKDPSKNRSRPEADKNDGKKPSKSHSGNNQSKKKKKKKNAGLKVAIGIICGFIALGLVIGAGASAVILTVLKDYNANQMSENSYIDESTLLSSDSVYNVLLMGIDTLNTDSSSRSDAMILLSVDMKHKKIKLTSFLRDSYVEIPGHGSAKLNASCVYGGPQLVCDTIEYNFGIKIDDYAKIGYDMFIEIIDAVGGVTIPEIDDVEAAALAKEGFSIAPGTNIKLDGYHALLYCRIRSGQNDFYRTSRQREVISQVIKGLTGTNPMTLIDTATEIAKNMECSIDQAEFLPLAMKAATCLTNDVEQFSIPADGTWYNDTINSQAVLVMDFAQNKAKLNEFIYEQ